MCHPCHAFAIRTTGTRGHVTVLYTRTRGHSWHSRHSDSTSIKTYFALRGNCRYCTRLLGHTSVSDTRKHAGHTRGICRCNCIHWFQSSFVSYSQKIFGHADTRTFLDTRSQWHSDTVTIFSKTKSKLRCSAEEIVVESQVAWVTSVGVLQTHLGLTEECVGHIGFQLYDLQCYMTWFNAIIYEHVYSIYCIVILRNPIEFNAVKKHFRLNSINKWHFNAIPVIWLDSMQLFMNMFILFIALLS